MAKILIVDSSQYSRSLLRRDLESAGHKHLLYEVESGADAIKRLESNPDIDIVLVNPVLPKMDGLTMVEKLKQLPGLGRIAFVMVASESNEFLKNRARSLGVKAWILKSCSRDHLLSAVDHVLRPAA